MSCPADIMRRRILLFLTSVALALASPTVFSVHDDILAFPQYEVAFSESYISETEAHLILERASYSFQHTAIDKDTTGIQSRNGQEPIGGLDSIETESPAETYQEMRLYGQEYLCSIPIVETPTRNETSEAEALAEEKKEIARAADRGWELLQDLEGGDCLYFISGWWSYSFCYNSEVTQFHQQAVPPGKSVYPPQRDPTYPQYVLGRAKSSRKDKDDEWGNEIEVHKNRKSADGPVTELQIKGDTRYLVQKMEGGTICDLTGKPRRIEIQYHCNPHPTDFVGWIKEVTTCSYLMVIYTPRLCSDVAFLPPKESKANTIACRQIVSENQISDWKEKKTADAELMMGGGEGNKRPATVGGIVIGGGKYFSKSGPKLPLPPNWQPTTRTPDPMVIAQSKGKAEGDKIEIALTKEDLESLELDPEMVEQLKDELQQLAEGKGWLIEIVEPVPGEAREIRQYVEKDKNEDGKDEGESNVKGKDKDKGQTKDKDNSKDNDGNDQQEDGGEETYKTEL